MVIFVQGNGEIVEVVHTLVQESLFVMALESRWRLSRDTGR